MPGSLVYDRTKTVVRRQRARGRGRRPPRTWFRNALKLAGLPHRKTLDEFDFAFQPELDPRTVRGRAGLGFVTGKANVAWLETAGVGKTHLAVALAVAAWQAGYSV